MPLAAVLHRRRPPAPAAAPRRLVGEDLVELDTGPPPWVQTAHVGPLVVATLEILVRGGAVVVEVLVVPVLLLDAEVDLGSMPHIANAHARNTLSPVEDAPHPYD